MQGGVMIVDDTEYRRQFPTNFRRPRRYGHEVSSRRTIREIVKDQYRVESHLQLLPQTETITQEVPLAEDSPTYAFWLRAEDSPYKA